MAASQITNVEIASKSFINKNKHPSNFPNNLRVSRAILQQMKRIAEKLEWKLQI